MNRMANVLSLGYGERQRSTLPVTFKGGHGYTTLCRKKDDLYFSQSGISSATFKMVSSGKTVVASISAPPADMFRVCPTWSSVMGVYRDRLRLTGSCMTFIEHE